MLKADRVSNVSMPRNSQIVSRGFRLARLATALLFLLLPPLSIGQTQTRSVVCRGGDGKFDAQIYTGVRVHVGAARSEGGGLATLAARACAAKLEWEKQDLPVVTGASQLDLDVFGVDLGDGVPVAALQIKKSDTDCCVDYGIYSLNKPPRLLRSITGGEFFSASDVDLDGRVEIWTNDAAAVNGFDGLTLGELDSVPTVVFRFAHGRLVDVSAEFQSYFDDEIMQIRAGLVSHEIEDFKNTDGRLAETPTPASAERLHRMRATKIKILEIVWAYLYSGRDQDAWRSLTEMWPPADVDRIRAALLNARTHGIHGQADDTSAGPPRGKKKRVPIFDAVMLAPGRGLEVAPPRAILLELPASGVPQQNSQELEMFLDLVIDSSGKVRSVETTKNGKSVAPETIKAALTWKFIPAFKDGRPVASRLRLDVSPKQ
jgi:hypothetical protein